MGKVIQKDNTRPFLAWMKSRVCASDFSRALEDVSNKFKSDLEGRWHKGRGAVLDSEAQETIGGYLKTQNYGLLKKRSDQEGYGPYPKKKKNKKEKPDAKDITGGLEKAMDGDREIDLTALNRNLIALAGMGQRYLKEEELRGTVGLPENYIAAAKAKGKLPFNDLKGGYPLIVKGDKGELVAGVYFVLHKYIRALVEITKEKSTK
jgi:hypothetical protein